MVQWCVYTVYYASGETGQVQELLWDIVLNTHIVLSPSCITNSSVTIDCQGRFTH